MHLALSHIAFRRKYRPPFPSPLHTHLELLKLVSLLLLTDTEGDVAAVMFRVLSKERLELHYAKNRPCTDKENKYIREIFDILARDENRDCHLLCWDILSLAITECKRKIKSRTRKVCLRLRELSAPNSAPYASASFAISGSACTAASENYLREALGQSVFPVTTTMPQLLRAWFIHLLRRIEVVTATWNIASVYHLLRLAYCFSHAPHIEQVLDTGLIRRVRKLGDYYNAALSLISHAEQIPRDSLRQLHIVEAVPPTPCVLVLRANPVDTVNAWARHIREPEVSERDLRSAFPEMDPTPTSATGQCTVSAHCECTLLLKMINATTTTTAAPPVPMLLEIGVSKSSCFMCREFVAAVQSEYRHITVLVTSCHGKHVAGWMLPESAPAKIKDLIRKKVHDEMDDILQRTTRKRMLDSIPRESGPSARSIPSAEQVAAQLGLLGAGLFRVEDM